MEILQQVRWFVYQQDYFWFLATIGWVVVLLAWRRLKSHTPGFAWLPWAAGAGIATAILEVSQLVTPVKAVPNVPSYLFWDLAIGGTNAVLALALWWHGAARDGRRWHRWAGLGIGAVTAGAAIGRSAHRLKFEHWSAPEIGSWIYGGVALTAAVIWCSRSHASRAERLGVFALAGSVVLGSAGPVAETLRMAHRVTEVSTFGLYAALLQLVAIGSFGRLFYIRISQSLALPPASRVSIVRSLAVWLSAGLLLAAVMGRWAQGMFERDLLTRAELSSKLIDTRMLASALGPEFRVEEIVRYPIAITGRELLCYRSTALQTPGFLAAAKNLTEVEIANRDAQWALVLTMRSGWLVLSCISTRWKGAEASLKTIYGLGAESGWAEWATPRPHLLGPANFPHGQSIQSRTPLRAPDGRMLGWLALDYRVAQWVAAQVQARLLAFAVVGLGGALLVANWIQREHGRRREAADEASRLKTTFLAKVSHELRTPIQSLLGYGELLRPRVAGDAKAEAWIDALQQHGELMTRLVNDLIDLSATEAGAFRLALKPILPADIVSQVVESFRPQAEAKGLVLHVRIDPADQARWVVADGARFRQIAINLVSNAVKFTDAGSVAVTLATRALGSSKAEITLRVSDTGPGIPPALQSRLFVPFSRVDVMSGKEGSGLGLALSAALCKAHGGDLSLESDGASGSTFSASLRAEITTPPQGIASANETSWLQGRPILVVDDNVLVRELFTSFLTERGARCVAAATGAEAIAQANSNDFAAIILDLALADTDGAHVARELRKLDGAKSKVRIVGVSAHAGAGERARALAAGMDVFLSKPVTLRALAEAITGATTATPAGFATADAPELRRRLVQQFRIEVGTQRDSLQRLVTAGEWPGVRAAAHYLKNSAIVVGDDTLSEACATLEQASTTGDRITIEREWHRCCRSLERWQERPHFTAVIPSAETAAIVSSKIN